VSQSEEQKTAKPGSSVLNNIEDIVGGKPILQIKIGNVSAPSLFDTGSQVTTTSYQFFKEHIEPQGVTLEEGRWFALSGANGLDIPYIGLVLMDIEADGIKLSQKGILVMKDSETVAKQRKDVPIILGMNVIEHLPCAQELLRTLDSANSSEAGSSTGPEEKKRCKLARLASECMIPANTVCNVPVCVPKGQELLLVEPLSNPLPGHVLVANTLIDPSEGYTYIRVMNPGDEDVWLPEWALHNLLMRSRDLNRNWNWISMSIG